MLSDEKSSFLSVVQAFNRSQSKLIINEINLTHEYERLDFQNNSASKGLSFISGNHFLANQTMKSSVSKEFPSVQILSDDDGDLNELIEPGEGSHSESSGENY